MLTVDDLFRAISEITNVNNPQATVERSMSYYKACIDFCGKENVHLKNPLNDFKIQPYSIAREEQHCLNGNEIVYGNVLLFYYCGHDGLGLVQNFNSVEDMEKIIYGFGNLGSPYYYTEMIGVIVENGRVAETKVYVNGH